MPEQYYKEALKLAEKEVRACKSRGENPGLAILDQIIPPERTSMYTDMGYAQIPTELVVGTRTAGRTNAFARNFMPLLEPGTEFATKWENLCRAHLQEGIRDPLKVFEYMHRYYVEEGNKRLSVLKFFGATTAYAQVFRILPERNGSNEVELYYEYLDFHRYSKVNFIELSKRGSYARLQSLVGKAPEERWSDEDRSRFASTYYYFRQAYEACGGKKLDTTVGDAMLAFMQIYGYQDLRFYSKREMKQAVSKVWEEITLQQEESPIDLMLTPEATDEVKTKGNLLTNNPITGPIARPIATAAKAVVTTAKNAKNTVKPKTLKVAFIHDKAPAVSGWTRGHEQGRHHVDRIFRGKVVTKPYFNAMEHDAAAVIEEAVADGSSVIFTTSPRLLPASLTAAARHPDIIIMSCAVNKSHRLIRNYYSRIYESKFLLGAIAGTLAEDGRIGYVNDYPIYGQVAAVNAFALGVQMTNPRAKVYLEWSCVGGVEAANQRITDRGITLISAQDINNAIQEDSSTYGLFRIRDDGEKVNLAVPVWNWGVYYERLLRQILEGSIQAQYEETSKALNYFWGMSSGVVDVQYTDALPESSRKLGEFLRRGLCNGTFSPFDAPLRTQGGWHFEGNNRSLSQEQIVNMDYLMENIVGALPVYQELSDAGKSMVDLVGVEKVAKEKN